MNRARFLFLKRIRLVASAIIFLSALVCAKGNDMGTIILSGWHGQLLKYSLDSGGLFEFAKVPGPGYSSPSYTYRNLAKVDDDLFLFETPRRKLGLYTISTLQEEILFEHSSCPTYFESTGEVLFIKSYKTDSGFQGYLYLSDLDGANPVALKKIPLGTWSYCPVKLNESEAVLSRAFGIGKGKEPVVFNIKDRAFTEYTRSCKPLFVLSGRKLLCSSDGSYFIADSEGRKLKGIGQDLLNGVNMYPKAYFKEINSLLVQEYQEKLFGRIIRNIWLVDMATLEKRLVAKQFTVNRRGAIYIDH